MTISPEILEAVRDARGAPVHLHDPNTNQEYVVLRKDEFDRLRQAGDADDWSVRDMAVNMAQVMSDDWNDPAMDSYDALK